MTVSITGITVLLACIWCLHMDGSNASFQFTTLAKPPPPNAQLLCPDAQCKHDGVCDVGNHVCKCPSGYAGNLCEHAVCHLACENNGTCIGPNYCRCPRSHSGNQCQECTTYGRERCPVDTTCAVREDIPGVCCPPCRHRFWRDNCSPGQCTPVSGCVQYRYRKKSDCCPKCVKFKPSCMDTVCTLGDGCVQLALKVGRGKCCPRCKKYRCSGIECPVEEDCIEFHDPSPGQCCPRCKARRSSCHGITCEAFPNCAVYIQKPGQCCAECKRIKQAHNALMETNPCSTIQCPASMECAIKAPKVAVCRCKRNCRKKRRTVCGSDGNLHKSRCRLLRSACLKAMAIRPVPMAFCTYYGPKIQQTLSNLQDMMMTQTNSHTNTITLLGDLL